MANVHEVHLIPMGDAQSLWLEREPFFDRVAEEFAERWSVYPVTIVQARYSGTYEGAPWLCFPLAHGELSKEPWFDWDAGDVPCYAWWTRARDENWMIGYGRDPHEAYLDLVQRACLKAGVLFDLGGGDL